MRQSPTITKRRTRTAACILLVISLLTLGSLSRLLSLDDHWSSDESRWLRRSAKFMAAVKTGELSETLIAYHPGVTTMWLAGLRTFFVDPGVNVRNLAFARRFICITVWIGIGIACFLLYKLFGRWVAIAGFASLAYSPLFLAQTRRVHTDALATTFIFLTVLLFLLYCQNRHTRFLIFSGTAFGLALLSKSYALILLPWIPICMFLFREKQKRHLFTYVAEGICFLNCAALTVLTLWPVFWTPIFGGMILGLLGFTLMLFREMEKERCPIWLVGAALAGLLLACIQVSHTVWLVLDKVNWGVSTPHEVEHFFLGKIVNDPGWLFYPFVLTIRSAPLMLPLAICGVFLLWKQRKQSEETLCHFRMLLSITASIILFTACLSITSKKFSRYLLPAFPMLEILAAIGFVEILKGSYAALRSRFGTVETAKYKTALAIIACVGFFVIQVVPVLARHPYYGTYYNPFWKVSDITKIITVGEASGLDLAASYLNQKPNAHRMLVQVSPLATEFVRCYFRGFAYRSDKVDRVRNRVADYEVVYIRDSQIDRVPQTGTLNGELEAVITLNGIDHVWIYRIEKS